MTLNPSPKSFLVLLILAMSITEGYSQQINSLGIFTGITVPYTFDAGINKDPRYRIKYDVKFAPFGIHYGVDYDGYGLMIDPSITKIGQNFNVINIQGGHVGERKIDLTYFQFPIGVKLHIIDLSFFRVSFVASIGVGFLLDGQETITHRDSKLIFPSQVYPELIENPLYDDYLIEYDGVLSPNVSSSSPQSKLLSKEDFQSFQLFGGIGFRSDWDITEEWRVSFDLRGNVGALEPRKSDHIDKIKAFKAVYEIDGNRRDLFLALNIGIARTIEIGPQEQARKVRKKNESKPHRASKYPWQKPRNKKPKN
jgi:hypothetical protein